MKIGGILKEKGSDIVTISPDAKVRDLVALLNQHNIGALVVTSDGQSLEGMVSERDIVRNLSLGLQLADEPVRRIMTTELHTCGLDADVDALRRQMTEYRIRHIPVVEDGRLVGIVSIGDVVKSAIVELEFERDQLSNYVNQ